MARQWTASQQTAMNIRNRLTLVSAAAGSGKTSVLTERIIRRLTDREHPADISRLLVVTFTRAAAAELKNRIAAALSEALAEHPDDERLSRQLFLLGSAQISTIDSFFGQAVRANFEQLELPAAFRTVDRSEVLPIALEIMDGAVQTLYAKYEQQLTGAEPNAPFARLSDNRFADCMDHLMSGRSDGKLCGLLLEFEEQFASYPEGVSLLLENARELRRDANGDFLNTRPGTVIRQALTAIFSEYLSAFGEARDYLDGDPIADGIYSGLLEADITCCKSLLQALRQGSFEALRAAADRFPTARFPSKRGYEKPPAMETYMNVRNQFKADLKTKFEPIFRWSPEQIRMQMLRTAELCEMLYELFTLYEARIMEEKKSRGILEFNDIRAALYRLLTNENENAFVKSLSDAYDEIYIDEYQDVDSLQDRIFSMIGENRRFMVGDIKQSIYGFRGSEPTIFSSYRRAMPLSDDESAKGSPSVCVFMSENFRCNKPIIDFANRVCAFLFSACAESVDYRPQDDLVCSKKMPDAPDWKPAPVMVRIFEKTPKSADERNDENSGVTREQQWVAAEIERLLRDERTDDGRPILPGDVAILVRNGKHGTGYAKALEARGIPVSAPAASDLLRSPLTVDLLNLLQAVDNPYRDIPLSEYLLTPEGGFTPEELSLIREATPSRKSLYDAICAAAKDEAFPFTEKARRFTDWLEGWRRIASVQSADRFLRLLYQDPSVAKNAATPELLFLYEQARINQRTTWCGLYGFLEHFSRLADSQPVSAQGFRKSESAVTVMTIHHSKGLEFPVVFLASCGSPFNKESMNDSLIYHRATGCGTRLFREETGENENTVLREAARLSVEQDESEESIRVLYVALTRARERLYVTGTLAGKPESAFASASLIRRGARYSILRAGNYLKWILAAIEEPGREKLPLECCDFRVVPVTEPIESPKLLPDEGSEKIVSEKPARPAVDPLAESFRAVLAEQEHFRYPLDALRGIPTKAAASKLRPDLLDVLKNADDEPGAIQEQIELMRSASPNFDVLLSQSHKPSATEIGTATHAFLEFCDLSSLPDRGIDDEIERLVDEQFLSPENAKLVNRKQLEAFVGSDLMREIRAAKALYREQKFSLFLPLSSLTSDTTLAGQLVGQNLFVQGSIDLILETADGRLLLYDYKTDRIPPEQKNDPALLQKVLEERHGNQLACYAQAVRELFGRAPDGIFLYSLPLGRSIQMK